MTLRIPERIPPHELGLAKLLDQQIAALQRGDKSESVFDNDDLKIMKTLGTEKYLACLTRMRHNLGQPDGLSEE